MVSRAGMVLPLMRVFDMATRAGWLNLSNGYLDLEVTVAIGNISRSRA